MTKNIVILNPNSTESMTQEMARGAIETIASSSASSSSFRVTARTNMGAPAAIQGPLDAQAAIAGMLKMVEEYIDNMDSFVVDAFIIGCADDVGFNEIHALLNKRFAAEDTSKSEENGHVAVKKKKPALFGITQAASIAALSVLAPGSKFGIVTTVPEAVPVLQGNLQQYGTHSRCSGVLASGVPVLELEEKPQESLEQLCTTIAQAQDQGADAIILGCAGMSPLRAQMRQKFPSLVFIDGVQAATRMAVAMCGLDE